jgi:YesN/AraC family two-component response regulator
MIHVLIVDDQRIIREGIESLLSQASEIKILGKAKDGETALQKIAEQQPDIVLLDINLPDTDGLTVAEKISYRFPEVRTIMLSSHEESSYVEKAISFGAKGYLFKNVSSEELEWSIKLIYRGYSIVKSQLLAHCSLTKHVPKFTLAVEPDTDSVRKDTDVVQIPQAYSLPKLESEQPNLDGIEDLLIKNHIQQRYAKYDRQRQLNLLFCRVDFTRFKKTVTSFEFTLLVFIILFSLGFLVFITLS